MIVLSHLLDLKIQGITHDFNFVQDIQIRLLKASNGGRIKEPSTFTLTILSNDNPHGVVQLATNTFTVQEGAANSVQQIPLVRT